VIEQDIMKNRCCVMGRVFYGGRAGTVVEDIAEERAVPSVDAEAADTPVGGEAAVIAGVWAPPDGGFLSDEPDDDPMEAIYASVPAQLMTEGPVYVDTAMGAVPMAHDMQVVYDHFMARQGQWFPAADRD
jgi:hypothetical protein